MLGYDTRYDVAVGLYMYWLQTLTPDMQLPSSAGPNTEIGYLRTGNIYVSSDGQWLAEFTFATIVAASKAAQPGRTVSVAAEGYAGGFDTTARGSASVPITYVSEMPHGAVIVGGGSATNANRAEERGKLHHHPRLRHRVPADIPVAALVV
jgi:hypothetical protein